MVSAWKQLGLVQIVLKRFQIWQIMVILMIQRRVRTGASISPTTAAVRSDQLCLPGCAGNCFGVHPWVPRSPAFMMGNSSAAESEAEPSYMLMVRQLFVRGCH